MSNIRKTKTTNSGKDYLTKPEPTKAVSTKPAAPQQPVGVKTYSTQPTATKPAGPQATIPAPASAPRPAPVRAAPVTAAPAATVSSPAKPSAPQAAEKPRTGHVSLELVQPNAKNVCVAGSFNGWKPEKTPLVRMGNGRWVGDFDVNPGKYEYLFVVDGQWVPDPNAKESVQNPFGGKNSILTVST